MGEGGVGPETGGGGAEVGQSIAAPVEAAVDTASQSLAGAIENIENTEGAGAAFSGLADGSLTAEAAPEAPDVEIKPEDSPYNTGMEATPGGVAQNPDTEIKPEDLPSDVEKATDEVESPAGEGNGESDTTSQSEIESTNATATPEATEAPEPTVEEASNEASELASKVDALNDRMDLVNEQMNELKVQRSQIESEIGQAIAEIPDIEAVLMTLMEKATPEQKKSLGLLMSLLRMLMSLAGSVMEGGASSGKSEKGKEASSSSSPNVKPINAKPVVSPNA
jgi:hypothetical protein